MHSDFWHERWRTGEIGFHQSAVHPLLARWWPTLDIEPGCRVYVPLCGRSLDMAWLAERGYSIVGSELSPIAVRDFFASQRLEPTSSPISTGAAMSTGRVSVSTAAGPSGSERSSGSAGPLSGGFIHHEAGPYTLLEGDALALTTAETGPIGAAYDRAALVALPPEMRIDYAASMTRLLSRGAKMLLIAFEYPQELRGGPPFSVEASEIRGLFEPGFVVRELERRDILAESPRFAELGIPALHETAFVLARR